MTLISLNPTNEEVLSRFEEMSVIDLEKKLTQTNKTQKLWRMLSVEKRIETLLPVPALLSKQKDQLARLMAQEMGKPILQGHAEIEKCILLCEYYFQNAKNFLQPEIIQSEFSKSFVAFEPLGNILGIMPWNFPFWQVFRFAIPALLTGNICFLKHAPNVSNSALEIEKFFSHINFDQTIFHTLLLNESQTSSLIEHPLINAVSFTGSVNAGRMVASTAARSLKKSVLELGGSDPYIIFDDADLEHAAKCCVQSRLINSGQSCIAAKRFIVNKNRSDEFSNAIVSLMKQITFGDPLSKNYDMGPLARNDLRVQLHEQVQKSVALGAKCLLGGAMPKGKGFFYPGTVLCNVKKSMPAYEEELFGPVASIIISDSDQQSIEIANDTFFGLGAAIFTKDIERGQEIAQKQLLAGSCFINDFVRSDPRLPFGGIKQSGFGRELSHFGLMEFVNIKTICVA